LKKMTKMLNMMNMLTMYFRGNESNWYDFFFRGILLSSLPNKVWPGKT
jgi:hypothetical protein